MTNTVRDAMTNPVQDTMPHVLLKPPVPATNVLNLVYSFQNTEILFQANRLHIFDTLENAGEPVEATKLAADLCVHPGALERLMNACVTLGLLVRTEIDSQVFFRNSEEASLYLTQDSPHSLLDMFPIIENFDMQTFKLEEPIKTGKQQAQKALQCDNSDPDDFVKTWFGTKERCHMFVHAMEALAKTCLPLIGDLSLDRFTQAVDLGGCFGLHARTLKKLHPKMKVTLADLKPVIEEAKKKEDNKNAGIEFAGCDFFDASSLPKADLYLLGHILHSWNEEKCEQILCNVYQALNSGGCLVILEKILSDSKTGDLFQHYTDLLMLVTCDGKARTQQEYRTLLEKQGFHDVVIHRDPSSPSYDAIMAYK